MARYVTIPIGPIFTGGACRGIIHVVEKGDTLYKLGLRYHVSVSQIMFSNPYVNVYNLQVGDELCIPVGRQIRFEEEMRPDMAQDMGTGMNRNMDSNMDQDMRQIRMEENIESEYNEEVQSEMEENIQSDMLCNVRMEPPSEEMGEVFPEEDLSMDFREY